MSDRRATPRSSSACPAPARPPVGRPLPHADRRRRAWLEPEGHLQFRGRLLRQGASTCRGSRAARSAPPATASARCWRTWSLDADDPDADFDDGSLTENTRSCYPLDFIPNVDLHRPRRPAEERGDADRDAFGVMPPIAKLTPAQAMYHFLSGYTAQVAGTEEGLGTEPQAGRSPPASARRSCRGDPVGLRPACCAT